MRVVSHGTKPACVSAALPFVPRFTTSFPTPQECPVTRVPISPEQLARYRETHRKRREARARALAGRRERAWAAARQAARLLKEEFGATRVVLFGSLAREGGRFFDERSDIDLAVWGVAPEQFFHAWAAVEARSEISFDLVDGALALPALRTEIESEGVEL